MNPDRKPGDVIHLPEPILRGCMILEESLAKRRSIREFSDEKLTLAEISQLLWAAHGVTEPQERLRTVPSAGALYPLEIYVALTDGFYHHLPHPHELQQLTPKDLRPGIARAALDQTFLYEAPALFVITAVFARTARTYGQDAVRYVSMETGHAAQNILLQAVALGLGGVPIGAFYEQRLRKVLALPADHEPLYVIPVGHPRSSQ